MLVKKIDVIGFRNLSQVSLETDANINCFYGMNGSGKTSLLESLFFLSRVRSFRTNKRKKVIQANTASLVVRAQFEQEKQHTLAVELTNKGDSRLKLDGEELNRLSEGTAMFPVQLITPESFEVFFSSPKSRRSFIDFGLFHVEQSYQKTWSEYQKQLKQVNALLRSSNANPRELEFWYRGLIDSAKIVDEKRSRFVSGLLEKELERLVESMPSTDTVELLKSVKVSYKQRPVLQSRGSLGNDVPDINGQIEKDCRYKQVGFGPSKSDLLFYIDGDDVSATLSRGQSKMLYYMLEVAIVSIIKQQSKKNILLLIDDLPSEVDEFTRVTMLRLLLQSKAQIFVTGIENKIATEFRKFTDSVNVFHVEHGTIKPEIME